MQFETTLTDARYDEDKKIWKIKTDKGDITCRYLISSVGQLHYPKMPNIKRIDQFKGNHFHSAQWKHDIDLTEKISGLSALQPQQSKSLVKFPKLPKSSPSIKDQRIGFWTIRISLIRMRKSGAHARCRSSERWHELILYGNLKIYFSPQLLERNSPQICLNLNSKRTCKNISKIRSFKKYCPLIIPSAPNGYCSQAIFSSYSTK